MGYENILYETDGAIVTVTLNRPTVLNALNHQTVQELRQAVDAFAKDDTARVMIMTGAGEKAFHADEHGISGIALRIECLALD